MDDYPGIEAALASGSPEALIAAFRAAGVDGAGLRDALGVTATAFLDHQQYQHAAVTLRAYLSLDDTVPVAWFNLGIALSGEGAREQAIDAYTRSLQLDGRYVAAFNNRASVLDACGRYDEAAADYDAALALDAHDGDTWCSRGKTLLRMGNAKGALESALRAEVLLPADQDVRALKYNALLASGRLKEANALEPRKSVVERQRGRYVVRYDERADKPSLLAASADALLAHAEERGMRPGDRSPFLWSELVAVELGRGTVLCVPEFSRAPALALSFDVTRSLVLTNLQGLGVLKNGLSSPTECRWSDTALFTSVDALEDDAVTLHRVGPASEGTSGWVVGAASLEDARQRFKRNEGTAIPTGVINASKPMLLRFMFLPVGTSILVTGAKATLTDARGVSLRDW